MSLVIVGSVALDDIKTPGGEVTDSLGGSAIYASIAAAKQVRTNIVGVVGHDFTDDYYQLLHEQGVNTEGLERADGLTFKWKGVYTDLNKAVTLDTQLNVFGDFDPKLPESYKGNQYLFLGNIHPALQLKVLSEMKDVKCVACDTMNFWIEKTPDLLNDVIKKVDILFINEDEIKMLTDESNIYEASEQVLKMGPTLIVVKRGEYGAVAISSDRMFYTPVYPVRQVLDPTGAGDSFAGGFLSVIVKNNDLSWSTIQKAMLTGTITASFNIQSFSCEALRSATQEEIEQRINQLISYTEIIK